MQIHNLTVSPDPRHTRIKICGLTRLSDIAALNIVRPDYAGFIFAPSRRQLSIGQALPLRRALAADILPVGVFVNESPDRICELVDRLELAVVQLHGQEDDRIRQVLRQRLPAHTAIWQKLSVPAEPAAAQNLVRQIEVNPQCLGLVAPDVWLLDTAFAGQTGGTGQPFPWLLLQNFCREHPVMLAGGLTPANVAKAIEVLHPYGVDCSSGVERQGQKDPGLMTAFCQNVRDQERRGRDQP